MSADSSRYYSDNLVLDNSAEGVVITGIKDDKVAARSGLQTGDEIVAATIHLDHLNKNEVMNILKVLEPYDSNIKVLTKKQLDATADLGSFGLGLKDPAKMLNLKKDLSLDAQAPIVSLDGLNGKLNAPQGFGGNIGGPTLNGDLPSLNLKKPSADGKFTMPSLGLTGPDIQGDLDSSFKAPNVSVSTPKLKAPNASLNVEKPGLKTGNLKYKAPNFTMPQFNLPQIKTPKGDMDVSSDLDLPSISGNLEKPNLNLSAPKLDLKSPDLDLNGPKLDMNGPDKIKWPHMKWKGGKVKGPDADLSAPDFNLNTPKIGGDLSGPDVDFNLPKADINGPDLDAGKINWPHHKWKKPKLHGPKADLDLDANLNSPNVDASLPKVDGGINVPGVDMDGELPSGKTHWPHWKWKKPKLHGPKADIDADLNTPDLNFSTPKIDVPNAELNLPNANLNGPNADFQAPDLDGKVNWPHHKWKKPKLHGPKADLSTDLSTPDLDLSAPKFDGGISTPDIDLNLPKANVDVKAPDAGKIKFPTIKKPKFMLSGSKVKGPDIDFDADVKAPDLNLSPQASFDGPDVDVNLPKADVDPGKIKWPTIKMPKWSGLGPKLDSPNLDADLSAPDWSLKAPKIDGELNAPDLNLDVPKADLKGPDLDIDTPDFDSSGKLKWFNFKKPTFGTLNGPKGDIDADLQVPDVDLKAVDVNMSAPKIDGGIKTPDLNFDLPKGNVAAPNIDLQAPAVDASAGKMKLPKLNFPKFGWSGPRVKTPNLNVDADNVDFPDVNLNLPKADVKAPNLNLSPDIDLNADLKTDLSAPKTNISLPDIDFLTQNSKGPNVNLNLPKADVTGPSLDLPKADLQIPDLNLKAPDLSLSSPKMNGNLSTPKADLKAPNLDINLPKADLKGPQIKTPDLDFDSHLGDFDFPNFKRPNLGLSSPELDIPSLHPSVEAGIEAPKVNIGTPNVDANLEKSKFPSFKFPKMSFPGQQLKAVDDNTNANLEFSPVKVGGISAPELKTSLNTPALDITAEADADVKGSPKSKSRWPFKWGLRSSSGSNEDGSGDDSENDVSTADVEMPVFRSHKLPRNSLNGIGGIEDILSTSKLETEAKDYVVSKGIRLPIVNNNAKSGGKVDIMERLKMSMDKTPSANASANVSPTEAKTGIDLKLSPSSLADSSLARGGTFRVEKPESALGLATPEISTSDENAKMSLSLSNMLGL
ncbi:Neuroblast differentiation-associated protein AHNAK [Liparis tanakae]|uniref:Neuroblast differentiation-associated protein AHNAK n=1 Tax=Liparis tanakae TaxID=230148 RepID=A0A4Z2G3A5_9TELE|nr:Neuroblast differentiation-associated protein AHNAK [Liparis tanakae]